MVELAPLAQDLRTRSMVAGEAETSTTDRDSGYMDVDVAFSGWIGKGVTPPVKNSLTKLIRLPLDPALLENVPFLAGFGRGEGHIEATGRINNPDYRPEP